MSRSSKTWKEAYAQSRSSPDVSNSSTRNGTKLNRDASRASASRSGTTLFRDDKGSSPRDGTTLHRETRPSNHQTSSTFNRDYPTSLSQQYRPQESQRNESILSNVVRRRIPWSSQGQLAQNPAPRQTQSPRDVQPTSQSPFHNAKMVLPTQKSVIATRQIEVDTLSHQEHLEKEERVKTQLTAIGAYTCCGLGWVRKEKGYRCLGFSHCVTEALLAEGDGGCYFIENTGKMNDENEFWQGPCYQTPGTHTILGWRNNGDGWRRPRGTFDGVEFRPPRMAGIPSGRHIPGSVLGIECLRPKDNVDVPAPPWPKRPGTEHLVLVDKRR